jgi:predicted ATPase
MNIQIRLTEDPHVRMLHYLSNALHSDVITVLLSPSRNRFDDFGIKAMVEVHIFSDGEVIAIPAKMLIRQRGFDNVESNVSRLLQQQLERLPREPESSITKEVELSIALENHEFLTALADRDAYRMVINALGEAAARRVLESLHDVGMLIALGSDLDDFRNLSRVAAFGQSLLRLDETFIAVWDLNSLFVRSKASTEPDSEKVLTIESPILEKNGKIELTFAKGVFGRNRLNVFIGENGVGKTRLLRELADAEGFQDANSVSNFSSVLFIQSPLDEWRSHPAERSTRVPLIMPHPSSTGAASFTSKLVRLARSSSSSSRKIDEFRSDLPAADDFDLLQRAVEPFLKFDELYLALQEEAQGMTIATVEIGGKLYGSLNKYRLEADESRAEFFGRIDYERPAVFIKNKKIKTLSSGERALFGLAVTLIHDIPRSGLVLLDEPELALHPAMIATLIKLLCLILSARQAYCVIATHSLYVIREVPKEGVHVLKKRFYGVVDYAPMPETLGAGLTELSSVVFDDWKIDEYFKSKIQQVLSSFGSERQDEAIALIRREVGEAGILVMHQILLESFARNVK